MFQAALTTHDIDEDSARGTSIITDDKSSRWFSDEVVSECVYALYITVLSGKNMELYRQYCVMEPSKSS